MDWDRRDILSQATSEHQASKTTLSRRNLLEIAGAIATLTTGSSNLAASSELDAVAAAVGVQLKINGELHRLEIDPRQSILDVLREKLDLPGTKKGCNQGACGSCTVLLNGRRINSCLTLAVMHNGSEITTVEGLSKGEQLHPLQAAFIEHEGLQCGYCTAGQIVSGIGCMAEGHAGSDAEIKFWMSGNICRCGAYPGIVSAIADVAKGANQ